MRVVVFSVLFLMYLRNVQSQVSLLESGGDVKKPGEDHRLTCKYSGHDFRDYTIQWVRQQPGKGLEWLVQVHSDSSKTYYSPSVKGRFHAFRDNFQNVALLDMNNLKPEDSGVYYCARGIERTERVYSYRSDTYYYLYYLDYWGRGTRVTVTTETDTSISVFPVVPCCSLMKDNEVTIGCLFHSRIYPAAEISWQTKCGPVTSGVEVFPAKNASPYYVYSSLKVSLYDLQKNYYQCKIGTQTRNVTEPVCQKPEILKVKVYSGECAAEFKELICLVDDHFPKDVSVIWTVKGEPASASNKSVEKGENGLYKTRSTLSLKTDKWFAGHDITCKATAPKHGDTVPISKNDTIKSCAAYAAEVSILKLSLQDLFTKNYVTATCVVKAYPLQGVEIIWKTDEKIINKTVENNFCSENEIKTIRYTVSIPTSDWNAKKPYVCEAKHHCFKSSFEDRITKHEVKTPPSLSILAPFSDKNQQQHFLLCMINGDFPNGIYVKWQKNGEDVPALHYTNTEPQCVTANQKCSAQSKLDIPQSDRNTEANYTCMVGYDPAKPMENATHVDPFVSFTLQCPKAEVLFLVDEHQDGKLISLACSAFDFSPEDINITWMSNGTQVIPSRKEATLKMHNGKFATSAKINVSMEEWNEGKIYECTVSLSSCNNISRIISKSAWILPTPPALQVQVNSCEKGNITVSLICLISNFSPKEIEVKWFSNETLVSSNDKYMTGHGNQFEMTSTVTVPAEEWNRWYNYTCQVWHASTNSSKEVTVNKCTACMKHCPQPTVYVLRPSYQELAKTKKALITCIVVGYELFGVPVSWSIDGEKHTGNATATEESHVNGSQTIRSTLTDDLTGWNQGKTYTCQVTHPCFSMPFIKTIVKGQGVQTIPPSLYLGCPTVEEHDEMTLVCIATGFYPQDILVTWLVNSSAIEPSDYIISHVVPKGNMTFTVTSHLKISKHQWSSGVPFTCRAENDGFEKNVSKHEHLCTSQVGGQEPSVYLVKPSFEDLFLKHKAVIMCLVIGLDLKSEDITWMEDGKDRTADKEDDLHENDNNGTQTLQSQLKVSAEEWYSGTTFMCKVSHSSFPSPRELKISYAKDNASFPDVYILQPSPKELMSGDILTLICLMKGFYPDDIFVKWKHNDDIIGQEKYTNSPTYQKDKSYSMVSRLEIDKDEWNRGTTYTCVVGHVSLDSPIIRTANKYSDKPSSVNVSVVLTDAHDTCTV